MRVIGGGEVRRGDASVVAGWGGATVDWDGGGSPIGGAGDGGGPGEWGGAVRVIAGGEVRWLEWGGTEDDPAAGEFFCFLTYDVGSVSAARFFPFSSSARFFPLSRRFTNRFCKASRKFLRLVFIALTSWSYF